MRTELFKMRNGEVVMGTIIHQYMAFEGYMRYIFKMSDGRQYRCRKDADGNYIEEVI